MSTGLNARISANVRGELQRQSRSVAQLAWSLRISRRSLLQRLGGTVSFDTDELGAIAHHLDIGIAELIA
ncbi:MAG: hypothetical protein JWR32_2996 [Mycobacterium sp.]|jgi:hypothetical protein|nr:hypothetical protein [Mycobacterium sp.]